MKHSGILNMGEKLLDFLGNQIESVDVEFECVCPILRTTRCGGERSIGVHGGSRHMADQ